MDELKPLKQRRLCPHCRKPVIPSEIEGYVWQCLDCDEDFMDFECYKQEYLEG